MPSVQKRHKSCDECRTRKLRCSGEPDGCGRCRDDHVRCRYSLQKPMGRPRKRRREAEDDIEELALNGADLQHLPYQRQRMDADTKVLDMMQSDYYMAGIGRPHTPRSPQPMSMALGIGVSHDYSGADGGLFSGEFSWLNHAMPNDVGSMMRGGTPSYDVFSRSLTPPARLLANNTYNTPPPSLSALSPTSDSTSSTSASSPSSINGTNGNIANGISNGVPNAVPQAISEFPIVYSPPSSIDTTPEPQPCGCLSAFFTAISSLHVVPPVSSLTLPYTLHVARTALQTANISMNCDYCQRGGFQAAFASNMMLGCMLPLLVIFFQKSFENVERTVGPQTVVVGEGTQNVQEVQVELDAWKEMARVALRKEFVEMMDVVECMAHVQKPGIRPKRAMVPECGGKPIISPLNGQRDLPLCKKLINTIRDVAGRLRMKLGD